jgi:hypothetical protein
MTNGLKLIVHTCPQLNEEWLIKVVKDWSQKKNVRYVKNINAENMR